MYNIISLFHVVTAPPDQIFALLDLFSSHKTTNHIHPKQSISFAKPQATTTSTFPSSPSAFHSFAITSQSPFHRLTTFPTHSLPSPTPNTPLSKMPRQSRGSGGGGARAPSRPTVAPARQAPPPQQQQRQATTSAYPPQNTTQGGPPPVQQQQGGGGPGLFGQMASTAA